MLTSAQRPHGTRVPMGSPSLTSISKAYVLDLLDFHARNGEVFAD
jgi:hypothetical protein